MTTPLQAFALNISERVEYAEVTAQRMLGADWIDSYTNAWRIMDETYDLVMAPDRPAVYLPAKMISNPNSKAIT